MNNYELLGLLANVLQVANFQMNIQEVSNDELLKHLVKQDQVLDEQSKELQEQTNIYLKKIIEQNKEIIRILKGEKNEISKENSETN